MSGQANILSLIADSTRKRVRAQKEVYPTSELASAAYKLASEQKGHTLAFEEALKSSDISFICECKKASPSKGLISKDFDAASIARDYEKAGAAAISCLTEPHWFCGSDEDLISVKAAVGLPVLRKDFIVDEYMIYQAKILGADAVLLICSILDDNQLASYIKLADKLGLACLVEAYEPQEVPRAIAAGARVIGVNNRNLRTFEVDFGRSIKLRGLVGPERLFVSESGVRSANDVRRLAEAGVDAVLVGETLMRRSDRQAGLAELRGES